MSRHSALSARALVAAVCSVASLVAASAGTQAAPRSAEQAASPYIVVLNDSVVRAGSVAQAQADELGVQVKTVYSHALKGYAADLTPADVARLEADPSVAYVEADQMLTTQVQTIPTGVRRIFADDNPNIGIDGVDTRIDVDVAVIDTGVMAHPDLNVATRANCESGTCQTGTGNDDNGHGTHVAGSIAALDNNDFVVGVAPGARIHSVRVCNAFGQCPNSAIVAGVDYVTARASTIEVVNMSLGGPGSSTALSQAITRSVDAGVVYAVAAGNNNQNASGFFPASHPDVITVSALADFNGEPGGGAASTCRTDQDDTLASFSNWGATIEIAAPGTCILSTWNNGGTNTISGTSMASPHVAGAAALLTCGTNSPDNRSEALAVRTTIMNTGNLNWTDDSGDGVKERLLDVSNASVYPSCEGGPPPNPPTTVFFDDFETARGWTTNAGGTDTATTGQWVRGDPQATSSGIALQLGTTTSGVNDLVTGAPAGAAGAGTNDVDGGVTTVQSPAITLPATGTLTLSTQWYLAHLTNATSADFFRIRVVSGSANTVVFQQLGAGTNRAGAWGTATAGLNAFAGQSVRIVVETADAGTASLIEAGVDDLRITQQT